MEEKELRNLQDTLLIIMDEIDRICRKHNLRYSLFAGSLIGAVRHNGIIPWDDDIDICMPREDYDIFLEICQKELKKEFGVISMETKSDYGYGFSKIILKGTKIRQVGLNKGNSIFQLWVDIFPYDCIPNSIFKQKIHSFKNYFLVKILEERYDGIYGNKNLVKIVIFGLLHVINSIIPSSFLKNQLKNNMTKYNKEVTNEITCLSSPYKYEKEKLPATFFDKLSDYDFCGRKYLGYTDYDFYLTKIYGDYMKIPPKNKRHTHNLEIIDFGVYWKNN